MWQPYIQILTTILKNMSTGYDKNIAGFSNTIMTSNEMEIMRSWSKTMFSTPPTRIPKDVSSNLFSKMCSSKFVSSKIRINNIWLGVNQTNSFKKTLYNRLWFTCSCCSFCCSWCFICISCYCSFCCRFSYNCGTSYSGLDHWCCCFW